MGNAVDIRCLFLWVVSPETDPTQGDWDNLTVPRLTRATYPTVRGLVTASGKNGSSGGLGKVPVEINGDTTPIKH
jgi:hypothetical protein